MPPNSTVKQVVQALQDRQTNTTKALDQLFANPGRHRSHPVLR